MKSQSYVAHESFWTDLRMWLSMIKVAFIIGFLIQFLILIYSVYDLDKAAYLGNGERLPMSVFLKYHANFGGLFDKQIWSIEDSLLPYSKGWSQLPSKIYNQMVDYATAGAYARQHSSLVHTFYYSFGGYIASVLYIGYFIYLSGKRNEKKFIRGAQITDIESLNNNLLIDAKSNPLSVLRIGDTILPFEMESKHMLILGTSGSGKGVLLNQLISQINQRKANMGTQERCIFYDLKGEFVEKQMNPGDIIFSPVDARSVGWNIFNEIETRPDFDIITKSLFVSPEVKNEYWYNCAGEVFRAGLIFLKMSERTTNRELWNFFSLSTEEIIDCFKRLPLEFQGAIKHIDKTDSSTSSSIISVLQDRIKIFEYLIDIEGDFSFRKYIRGEDQYTQNLFILNIKRYSDILRPLMTLAIDTMINEVLSLPDNLNRRIWFMIDELGSLYKMESIIQLETIGRSKGACLVCANQDLGSVEELYGKAKLKTFYNNFNTNFTFRIREPETAEYLSKAIGDQETVKTTQSRQMSPSDIGDRRTENDQEKVERLIMPVEFQKLDDLNAIINIAGYGISRIQIPPIFYDKRNENFVLRQFTDIGELFEPPADEEVESEDESLTDTATYRITL